MNTQIKFRAWDKGKKEMVNVLVILFGEKTYLYTQRVVQPKTIIISSISDVELMQYTGLKDKNGVEIYEGDIVVIEDSFTETVDVGVGEVPVARTPDNHISEVFFGNDGCFRFMVRENSDVLSKGSYTWEQLQDEIGTDSIEVIGNKWENPELLK